MRTAPSTLLASRARGLPGPRQLSCRCSTSQAPAGATPVPRVALSKLLTVRLPLQECLRGAGGSRGAPPPRPTAPRAPLSLPRGCSALPWGQGRLAGVRATSWITGSLSSWRRASEAWRLHGASGAHAAFVRAQEPAKPRPALKGGLWFHPHLRDEAPEVQDPGSRLTSLEPACRPLPAAATLRRPGKGAVPVHQTHTRGEGDPDTDDLESWAC